MIDERRTLLLRLLADIDEQIAEAQSLVRDATDDEVIQRRAATHLKEFQQALRRVEQLLGKTL
jgi:hypothetical protein